MEPIINKFKRVSVCQAKYLNRYSKTNTIDGYCTSNRAARRELKHLDIVPKLQALRFNFLFFQRKVHDKRLNINDVLKLIELETTQHLIKLEQFNVFDLCRGNWHF